MVDAKKFVIVVAMSLVVVTILNLIIASVFDFEPVKLGSSLIVLFSGVYLTILVYSARDKSVDSKDIIFLLLVAGTLVGIIFGIRAFAPELFSAFPSSTQNMFSAIGIK